MRAECSLTVRSLAIFPASAIFLQYLTLHIPVLWGTLFLLAGFRCRCVRSFPYVAMATPGAGRPRTPSNGRSCVRQLKCSGGLNSCVLKRRHRRCEWEALDHMAHTPALVPHASWVRHLWMSYPPSECLSPRSALPNAFGSVYRSDTGSTFGGVCRPNEFMKQNKFCSIVPYSHQILGCVMFLPVLF
jgi:hypothetical protein